MNLIKDKILEIEKVGRLGKLSLYCVVHSMLIFYFVLFFILLIFYLRLFYLTFSTYRTFRTFRTFISLLYYIGNYIIINYIFYFIDMPAMRIV
jgi:hypothetical protein